MFLTRIKGLGDYRDGLPGLPGWMMIIFSHKDIKDLFVRVAKSAGIRLFRPKNFKLPSPPMSLMPL
jgi:hypothetical protein